MAIIYFDDVVQRQVNDNREILFSWPRSGETFTYTYSLDGGSTFVAGQSVITEKPDDGDVAEYAIPYSTDERPTGPGTVIYKITDGTDTAKIYVNVLGVAAIAAPGTPSGETFTSLEEIQRLLSIEGVDNHTEDLNDNTTVINEIIYRATETVLQYLRGRYSISDMSTSYWVRMKATFIACYFVSIRQGNPGLYADLFAEAMIDLAQARDGIINPGLATPTRIIVQTPMTDSRFFHVGRINPTTSSKVFSGQRLPYRLGFTE